MKENIFAKMFDLRPLNESGDLDLEQIKKVQDFLDLRYECPKKKKNQKRVLSYKIKRKKRVLNQKEDFFDTLTAEILAGSEKEIFPETQIIEEATVLQPPVPIWENEPVLEVQNFKSEPFKIQETGFSQKFNRRLLVFASAGLMTLIIISGLSLAGRGLSAKNNILSSALEAYQAMLEAKDSAKKFDFSGAQLNFQSAFNNFLQAEQELNSLGGVLVAVLSKISLTSQVGSAQALLQAGEEIARAGWNFAEAGNFLTGKNVDFFGGDESLTGKFLKVQDKIKAARLALTKAGNNLNKVENADLPVNFVSAVEDLKQKTPLLLEAAKGLENWNEVALEVLGERRAKKYLLIFQNPSEARATGGFLGTYGVLDLDQGRIKNLFIDGVFNLDGQLLEKIVPPKPIQKISTAWSMHDANWFADFPTSAQKIMWFFEKGGGETVDGVISLTPVVFEKLLAITGPVDLPQYNVIFSADNFLETVQYKVEADYDKNLNQPKKILADFTPLFLEKIEVAGQDKSRDILGVLAEALAQKDILFYFSDPTLQEVFAAQGWSGEILEASRDYLNVINTNINGFKTDQMIEQKIFLQTEVQPDGSLINTIKIVRTHQGGQTPYEWYNQVNADYLRVYAPWGSKLLSARGQTLEINQEPIDYQKQGFKDDPEVLAQEQSLKIDPNSGTQIFEESGKTVFGNWVYVSPGKTVEITYQYLLPFKINWQDEDAIWSLLVQKQAGGKTSSFETEIIFPENPKIKWQYPQDLQISGKTIKFSGELKTDKFYGVVLTK